jgi:hypothetical protein
MNLFKKNAITVTIKKNDTGSPKLCSTLIKKKVALKRKITSTVSNNVVVKVVHSVGIREEDSRN